MASPTLKSLGSLYLAQLRAADECGVHVAAGRARLESALRVAPPGPVTDAVWRCASDPGLAGQYECLIPLVEAFVGYELAQGIPAMYGLGRSETGTAGCRLGALYQKQVVGQTATLLGRAMEALLLDGYLAGAASSAALPASPWALEPMDLDAAFQDWTPLIPLNERPENTATLFFMYAIAQPSLDQFVAVCRQGKLIGGLHKKTHHEILSSLAFMYVSAGVGLFLLNAPDLVSRRAQRAKADGWRRARNEPANSDRPAAVTVPDKASQADPVELIRELAKLREEGLLTDAEFEIKKEELLGRL